MKKYMKAVCLTLVLSMMLGTSGCALLARNMAPKHDDVEPGLEVGWKDEAKEPEAKPSETKAPEKEKEPETNSEVADNNTKPAKPTATPKPSVAEEELMSDYFISKMDLLMQLVDQYYMYDISVEDMRTGAYKGLLEGLGDPYTCFYTEEEFDALMESTTGTYYGIGAVVQQNTKTMYITIVKPYVDGPAYNAGMLPGDIIYMVNDVDVTGMDINNVVALMKGPEGTQVKVTVV